VRVVVSWSGFQQPIKINGSSIFRRGRTLPVTFRLTGDSAGITDLVARIYVAKVFDVVIGTELEALPQADADRGNTFRYTGDGSYVFNLATTTLSQGTWQLRVDLGDGTVNVVLFSIVE
jgi:hypothetical protein